jgi:glycosyltransferase involved in cell wall biosynthesis
MNISFDAKRAFHNNRGLGNYSRDVIRLLNTYAGENKYFLLNPTEKNNISFPINERTTIIYPNNPFHRLFPNYWRTKGCIEQLKMLGTDIYHGLSQELPMGIDKTGIKTVVTMHDAIFIRYPELYDSLYRKIFIKKNRYSTKIADKIIAISEQTKQDFIEFFDADPAKIEVVYQGCNNIFREKISEENRLLVKQKYNLPDNYLLNVGAIEKRKNLETIIRALAIGKIDLPLVVIGNKTAYLDEIKALIAEYKMEKQVFFFHNIVETKDLPAIYKMADVFIYPSVFEGFGIPILEALCTETPVITSKGSCFKETGGESSLYVEHTNADEMAYNIRKVLDNKELQQRMKVEGLVHSQKFTDENVAKNLIRVYESLK